MKKESEFERRKNRAIAIMAAKGMSKSHYAPPGLMFLWRAGCQIPPPPFTRFWVNLLTFAAFYAPLFGVIMWLMVWNKQGTSPLFACTLSLAAGLVFGLFMAAFHLWRRKANNLPDWEQL